MPIQWLFFDVGDVLFDENVPHLYYMHSILLAMRRHGVEVAWDDYRARIPECVRAKPDTSIPDAGHLFVEDNELWQRIFEDAHAEYLRMREPRPYGLLMDNMMPVIEELRQEFRLGIIANQHPPVLKAFDDYGISPYFDIKLINEVVGISKPDPAIFRMALEQAGVGPSEAMMIGDRPDNDIAPAKALGLRTLRFRHGILYTHYDPCTDAERADEEVWETTEIVSAVRRLAF